MPQPNKTGSPKRGRPSRAAVYERLRVQISELKERLGGLPSPAEAEGIWRGIWLEEAHHSTAIEGNTLVLKQVEKLLEEGRVAGNKELSEYLEVRGYADHDLRNPDNPLDRTNRRISILLPFSTPAPSVPGTEVVPAT